MFERSRSDTSAAQGGVTVDITLTTDETVRGKLVIPISKSAGDTLNSPGAFIEVCPFVGEPQFIAKASIKSLRLMPVPKASLGEAMRDLDGFDPHRILGVARDAGWEETRQSYLRLSKAYHPDRFAAADLPPEVADYLSAMVRRINAAFAALEDGREVTVRRSERIMPIYQSPNRQPALRTDSTPARPERLG